MPQHSLRTGVVLGVNLKPKLKPLVLIKESVAAFAVLDEQHLALVRHLNSSESLLCVDCGYL